MFHKLHNRLILVASRLQRLLISNGLEEHKPRLAHLPYVSGDTFMAFSDVAFLRDNKSPVVIKPNSGKKVLFVEGDLIERPDIQKYSEEFPIVIMHNSDNSPSQHVLQFFEQHRIHLFATNTPSTGSYVHCIPIGLENVHHRRNGSIHYYYPGNPLLDPTSLSKIVQVLASFSISTNERERNRAASICNSYGISNMRFDSLDAYRQALRRSMFVISPPGNGVDCHRTWEAIYNGAIPVIENKNYLYGPDINLPIYLCDNYEDFFQIDQPSRVRLYYSLLAKEYPSIYSDWWFAYIQSFLST
jgi:hypothetical protein